MSNSPLCQCLECFQSNCYETRLFLIEGSAEKIEKERNIYKSWHQEVQGSLLKRWTQLSMGLWLLCWIRVSSLFFTVYEPRGSSLASGSLVCPIVLHTFASLSLTSPHFQDNKSYDGFVLSTNIFIFHITYIQWRGFRSERKNGSNTLFKFAKPRLKTNSYF